MEILDEAFGLVAGATMPPEQMDALIADATAKANEVDALNAEIAEYAQREMTLRAMQESQERWERSIKERYLKLKATGVETPSLALMTKQRDVVKFGSGEQGMVSLALAHSRVDLLKQVIDMPAFKAAYAMDALDFAEGKYTFNTIIEAAWVPNALKMLAGEGGDK